MLHQAPPDPWPRRRAVLTTPNRRPFGGLGPRLRALAGLVYLLALTGAATKPATTGQVEFERWYSLLLMGEPAGWVHSTVMREGERLTSTERMQLSIGRGGTEMQIAMTTRTVETAAGRPIELETLQQLGTPTATRSVMRFTDRAIEMDVAGRASTAPLPTKAWLPAAAAQRHIAREYAAGARTIKYSSMDGSAGAALADLTMELVGVEKVEVLGKVVPAVAWKTRSSLAPGVVMTEHRDARGYPVKAKMTLAPGLELELVQSDQALATRKVKAPEVLAGMVVQPEKVIDGVDPRKARLLVVELALDVGDADAVPDLPSTGCQRVVWGDRATARLVVDLAVPVAPGKDTPGEADRQPSALIDSDHAKVRELLAKALAGKDRASPPEKAEALRTFVRDFVSRKNLSVGMASAGEVAQTAEGDCTEHGVLLAALLRAAGIPSRTATGLLYVPEFAGRKGVFAYHLWTQAWLEPAGAKGHRWVDLDATLPEAPFDATHLTLAVSNMSDREYTNDLLKVLPLLGRVKIRVLEVK